MGPQLHQAMASSDNLPIGQGPLTSQGIEAAITAAHT